MPWSTVRPWRTAKQCGVSNKVSGESASLTVLASKPSARTSKRVSVPTVDQDALFTTIQVGISTTDLTSGEWLRVNPAFCDMMGYSPRQLSD
jgi:PAS domain-containing protein